MVALDRFKTATSEQTNRNFVSSAFWKISLKKCPHEVLVISILMQLKTQEFAGRVEGKKEEAKQDISDMNNNKTYLF